LRASHPDYEIEMRGSSEVRILSMLICQYMLLEHLCCLTVEYVFICRPTCDLEMLLLMMFSLYLDTIFMAL
jgi:hypothetical protein